jgi:hypothetical protein
MYEYVPGGTLTDQMLGWAGLSAAADLLIASETKGPPTRGGRLPTLLSGSYSLVYASPQQRTGEPPAPPDDVHALGVIGYQMLTGDLSAAPGSDVADELRELGVPDELVRLIAASVAVKPDRRPKDAAEWDAVLAPLVSGRASGRQPDAVAEVRPAEEQRQAEAPERGGVASLHEDREEVAPGDQSRDSSATARPRLPARVALLLAVLSTLLSVGGLAVWLAGMLLGLGLHGAAAIFAPVGPPWPFMTCGVMVLGLIGGLGLLYKGVRHVSAARRGTHPYDKHRRFFEVITADV